jgi:hypothetical protein
MRYNQFMREGPEMSEGPRPSPEELGSAAKNTVEVRTNEITVQIIYGNHHRQIPAEALSPAADSLSIETAPNDFIEQGEYIAHFRNAETQGQYTKILTRAAEREIPLFMLDPGFFPGKEAVFTAEMLAEVAKTSLGSVLLENTVKHIKNSQEGGMTRRDFLKWALKGAGGLYLATGTLPKILISTADQVGLGEKETRALATKTESIYPTTFPITHGVRNAIMAEKLYWMGKNQTSRNVGLCVGAAHVGIETSLKASSDERLQLLRALREPIKDIFVKESLYCIGRLTNVGGCRWSMEEPREVESLKEIFT